MATLLDDALIADTLGSLPGWQGDSTRLWRDVSLDPDQETELRRQIDVDAGAMGHAPTFEQAEGATRIVLRTADQDGVTELDVALASHISDLLHRISGDERGVEAIRKDETVVIFRAAEGADAEEERSPGPPIAGGENTALFEPER